MRVTKINKFVRASENTPYLVNGRAVPSIYRSLQGTIPGLLSIGLTCRVIAVKLYSTIPHTCLATRDAAL